MNYSIHINIISIIIEVKMEQKRNGRLVPINETPVLVSKLMLRMHGQKDYKAITKLYSKEITMEIVDPMEGDQDRKYRVQLDFDTVFSVLTTSVVSDKQNKESEQPYAIKLEKYEDSIELSSDNANEIRNWQKKLSTIISQRNFHNAFKPIKKIGKGNFASVYLVIKYENDKQYAVKAFSKQAQFDEERGKQALENQINIMRALDHKYLMKLQEVYETENSYYLCFEYLSGGLLYDKIRRRYSFSIQQIKTVMNSLLEGLVAMHQQNIMHRDLKPENIIFRDSGSFECVIADFGLATYTDADNYIFTRCGTPGYVAPEISNIKSTNAKYGTQCDIFSLGIILHILALGESPFPGKQCNEVLKQNRQCVIDFENKDYTKISQSCLDLLKKMLEKQPEKRISAQQALKHHFFAENSKISCELTPTAKQQGVESPLMISNNPKRKRNLKLREDSCLKFKMREQIPINYDDKEQIIESINSPANMSKKTHRIRPDHKPRTFYPSNFKS